MNGSAVSAPTATLAGLQIACFASMAEAVNTIVNGDGQVLAGSAIAINPEKVVAAHDNPEVHQLLADASLRYADGIGVVRSLSRRRGLPITRIPGCELWQCLMARAGELQVPVFLVGASPEVLAQTEAKLRTELKTPVAGFQHGYFDPGEEDRLIDRIRQSGARIVSVALGSPRQERFIARCRLCHPDCFYMGVGGTYDVYVGKVKRAPLLFRRLNLEWFYRLCSQPTRWRRQLALVRYLWLEWRKCI